MSETEGSFLHGEDLFAQGTLLNTTTVPSMVNGNVAMGVSPIQTLEESSEEGDSGEELEDAFDDEDPLFEDLSPRSMDAFANSGDGAKDGVV